MKYLTLLAIVPMLVGPAVANPPCLTCATPKVRTIVKVKKEYIATAVFVPSFVATIAPFAVAAPTYAAPPPVAAAPVAGPAPIYPPPQQVPYGQLVPAQAAAPVCAPNNDLAMILQRLDGINARLCRLETPGGGQVPQPGPLRANEPGWMPRADAPGWMPRAAAPGGLPRALAKCVQCHTGEKAKAGFAMFDAAGKLNPLTDKQWRNVMGKTYSGAMPPKDSGVPPLTDEEVSELIGFATAQK